MTDDSEIRALDDKRDPRASGETEPLPMVALSVRQPWAWALSVGFKNIENRDWRRTNRDLRFRGTTMIHAGLREEVDAIPVMLEMIAAQGGDRDDALARYRRERRMGGIVGVMDVVAVVQDHPSVWFTGPYGLVIRNARPVDFQPCRGALGFFRPVFAG